LLEVLTAWGHGIIIGPEGAEAGGAFING
jgi:hypothetical protein